MIDGDLTILHVEDDPDLAWIVRKAFEDFGFIGTAILAKSIGEAFELLTERERTRQHLSLIISDMRLPDGSGLDLIREVKTNPYWRMTPVIVLSGERDQAMINAAYALGANSYLPKDPEGGNLVISLESFYKCWLQNVQLPRTEIMDPVQKALDRATGLRARTSEFYLDLARRSEEESEIKFWLDRALAEGNLSNLFAFFRDKLGEENVPPGAIDRVSSLQVQISNALIRAEKRLETTAHPDAGLSCRWVIELTDAFDEKVFVEALAYLFPRNPVVATALKVRAAAQYKTLALHVLEVARDEGLRQKALSLLEMSRLLEGGSS